MILLVAIIVVVVFATELILFSYFDGLHLRLRAKIEKQDQTIAELCKMIDKNFMKLAVELDKSKEE